MNAYVARNESVDKKSDSNIVTAFTSPSLSRGISATSMTGSVMKTSDAVPEEMTYAL